MDVSHDAGSSFMLVNGIPTDIGTFDLYTLMEQIRKEVSRPSFLSYTVSRTADVLYPCKAC